MALSRGDGTGKVPADFPSSPCLAAGGLCHKPADGQRGAPGTRAGRQRPPPPYLQAWSLRGCGAPAPLTARASPRTGRGAAAASGPWCRGAWGAGSEAWGRAALPPERGPRLRRLSPPSLPLVSPPAAGQVWARAASRASDGRRVCARLRGAHAGCPGSLGAPPPPAHWRRVLATGWRELVGAGGPWPGSPAAAHPPRAGAGRWALRALCGSRALQGGGREAAAPRAAPPWRPRRGGVSPITRLTMREARKARSEWTRSLRLGKGRGSAGAEKLRDPAGNLQKGPRIGTPRSRESSRARRNAFLPAFQQDVAVLRAPCPPRASPPRRPGEGAKQPAALPSRTSHSVNPFRTLLRFSVEKWRAWEYLGKSSPDVYLSHANKDYSIAINSSGEKEC